MTVARLGGVVEGAPTHRGNFLQRIDQLVALEAAGAARQQEPPCSKCGGPHPFDTSVPSVVWNDVIRGANLPDYLCLTCIVAAFAARGQSFTAQLSGQQFSQLPIEVIVDGREAHDAALIQAENNTLRWRVRELEGAAGAVPQQEPREQLRKHIAAIDGRRPQDGHSERGFATCPHPDCVAAHSAAVPALPAPLDQALEALAFAHGAIVDAVCCEDGLDGQAGAAVLKKIRAALTANGRTPPDVPADSLQEPQQQPAAGPVPLTREQFDAIAAGDFTIVGADALLNIWQPHPRQRRRKRGHPC